MDKTGNAKVHHHDHERQPPRRYGISDAELASEASDASNRLARLRHEAQVGREVKAATQRMYEPGGERLGRDLTTNLKNVERIEERLASRDGYGTSVRDIQDLARLHDEATLAAMRLDHEKTLIAKQQRLELLERAAEAWRKMNVKSQTLRPEEVQRALTDQYLETYSYD